MSRQQLLNMYQRQIALGGSSSGGSPSGGSGGLFTPASRAGLAEYRAWHAEYKMSHPGASREDFKEAWRMHKAGGAGLMLGAPRMGYGALVGGRKKPKGLSHCVMEKIGPSGLRRCSQMAMGPAGSALVGGARMSKGVRHCMQEVMEPSGVRRCAKYMPGPRSSMGSALVGGFPGQKALFSAWRRQNNCSAQGVKDAFAQARSAYSASAASGDFRAGVRAAEQALGLPAGTVNIAKLRLRGSRARAAPAAAPMAAPVEAALEAKHEAEQAQMVANEAAHQAAAVEAEAARDLGISDADLDAFLADLEPAGQGARARRRR